MANPKIYWKWQRIHHWFQYQVSLVSQKNHPDITSFIIRSPWNWYLSWKWVYDSHMKQLSTNFSVPWPYHPNIEIFHLMTNFWASIVSLDIYLEKNTIWIDRLFIGMSEYKATFYPLVPNNSKIPVWWNGVSIFISRNQSIIWHIQVKSSSIKTLNWIPAKSRKSEKWSRMWSWNVYFVKLNHFVDFERFIWTL
jgi:hypothetical protein